MSQEPRRTKTKYRVYRAVKNLLIFGKGMEELKTNKTSHLQFVYPVQDVAAQICFLRNQCLSTSCCRRSKYM